MTFELVVPIYSLRFIHHEPTRILHVARLHGTPYFSGHWGEWGCYGFLEAIWHDKLSKRFRCMSLNDNVSWMTAIANDYYYSEVFAKQLENYGRSGDLLMILSVSGNSPNVVKAVEWANSKGLTTIALVGAKVGRAGAIAQKKIVVQSEHYGYVEDAQMMICHMLCYAFMENPEYVQ